MNIPRPLLILIIIIIILAIVSCGAGVIRQASDNNDPEPTPGEFGNFVNAPVRARDVVANGDCTRNGVVITVGSNCRLTIDPQAFIPRVLRLQVTAGSPNVFVRQNIRGENRDSESDSFNSGDDPFEVSVSGTSPVQVFLNGSSELRILG